MLCVHTTIVRPRRVLRLCGGNIVARGCYGAFDEFCGEEHGKNMFLFGLKQGKPWKHWEFMVGIIKGATRHKMSVLDSQRGGK